VADSHPTSCEDAHVQTAPGQEPGDLGPECASAAERPAGERGERGDQAYSRCVVGEVAAMSLSRADEAEAHVRRSVGLAGAVGMRPPTQIRAGTSPGASFPTLVARCATIRYVSQPLSLRLPDASLERLKSRARLRRVPPRTLAQQYVEEGLRMDEHPLVRFVDGPVGRRARLVGSGLDVWEVIDVVRDNEGDVAAAADYLELPLGLIQAAVAYYGAHPDEIDEWIEANRRESEQAHAAWLAGQAALKR
jgi:uncharacterized protein (DUF433 family)